MCGIVGLYTKTPALRPDLGAHLGAMLETMTDRGPDSAGIAVYGDSSEAVKLTLRATPGYDFAGLGARLRGAAPGLVLRPRDSHAVVTVPTAEQAPIRAALANEAGVAIVGLGSAMEIYKEVGLPRDVLTRFGIRQMSGSHGIGHTRMATESAVTTDGAHPFSTGPDQCLVHNGSLSNHNSLRRRLAHAGVAVTTENDSEVAAAYLTWKMSEGATLGQALGAALDDLDGFYTFVVGTRHGFAVLRDPIACKPAVMAETADYVAFGSEYRALVELPGIETARVWEPEPATVYAWGQ